MAVSKAPGVIVFRQTAHPPRLRRHAAPLGRSLSLLRAGRQSKRRNNPLLIHLRSNNTQHPHKTTNRPNHVKNPRPTNGHTPISPPQWRPPRHRRSPHLPPNPQNRMPAGKRLPPRRTAAPPKAPPRASSNPSPSPARWTWPTTTRSSPASSCPSAKTRWRSKSASKASPMAKAGSRKGESFIR